MMDDQIVELLPARTTLRVRKRGGNGGRGGDATAVSAAVVIIEGRANNSFITADSGNASATGGDGGNGGDA